MSKKMKGGRRVKKKPFKIWPVMLTIVLVILTLGTISTAVKTSRWLHQDEHIIVEAGTPRSECSYSYQESDLGRISKFSISLFYKVSENVNLKIPGTYQVIYDSRFPLMKTYVHRVEVVDTTPPDLFLTDMPEGILSSIDDFVEPGYYACDNCDGEDVTITVDVIRSRPCWYIFLYTATDKSGNKMQQTREVNVVRGQVALTFDDGPSLNITPEILNVLARNDVRATFFILGFGPEKEALVIREFSEGHTIGYHGMSHNYPDIYSSLSVLMENFYKLEEKVNNLTGYTSKLIRFPGGASNTVSRNYCKGIMTAATEEVANYGYTYFDWNVDSGDAGSAKSAEDIYQNVVNGIRPGRFNVVLMHDASTKANTLEALQRIIDFCVENDYELVPLDSTSPHVQHGTAN